MTAPRAATPARAADHRQRRRHPTPWASAPGDVPVRSAARPAHLRPNPSPVFVDDSGRRRRTGRWIAGGVGALVLGYVAVVGMAFVGAPVVGRLAPPGVEQLSRPPSDHRVSVVPGAQERPLPTEDVAVPPVAPDPVDDTVAPSPAGGVDDATTGSSTTTTGVTTTTVPRGNGATTSVPTHSTAPERTRPTGPPAEPPGKP